MITYLLYVCVLPHDVSSHHVYVYVMIVTLTSVHMSSLNEFCERDICIEWIVLHLGDFLLVGPALSHECYQALAVTLASFASLGLSVVSEKTEGPTSTLVFGQ